MASDIVSLKVSIMCLTISPDILPPLFDKRGNRCAQGTREILFLIILTFLWHHQSLRKMGLHHFFMASVSWKTLQALR